MFKNLTMYRFSAATSAAILALAYPLDAETYPLASHLRDLSLRPIGPMELHTAGWVSPYGAGDDRLFQQVGDCIMLALGGESKVLPPAAVAAEVAKKVAEEEARAGRALGKRARTRLRDEVIVEMLPRAFTAPSRLCGYLDLARGFLVVDTASRKSADEFVHHFRRTLGSFPALPLSADDPAHTMTGWLHGDYLTPDLTIGKEWEFRDRSGTEAVWRGKNDDVESQTVSGKVSSGCECTKIALEYHDRLSFVFGDDLVIRKLRFLDGALDKLDLDGDDAAAEADARFALLAGEVGALFDVLAEAFKFSGAE
jgi:recombination associated protein RdgC